MDKQSWPVSFFWKTQTVSLIRRRLNILVFECDLHNDKYVFFPSR